MFLKVKFTSQDTQLVYEQREKPFAYKKGDSGIDLSYAPADYNNSDDIVINPGQTVMIPTGVCCQLESGDDQYEIQVRGRSGLNSKGIMTHIGTVDYTYTGEIKVVMTNLTDKPVTFQPGDRIAQIVVCPIIKPEIEYVLDLEDTDRGSKGFGSSGM